MKNLILIGMMGCGKTTVGNLLAQRFGWALTDTDDLIEAREGRSISAIFEENGEEYFRELERNVSQELAGQEDLIIACGGGLPLQAGCMEALKPGGVVFWLDRNPDEIYDTLDTEGRPLAQQGREAFMDRYAQRVPVYRQWADFRIAGKTAQEAEELITAIYREGHGI